MKIGECFLLRNGRACIKNTDNCVAVRNHCGFFIFPVSRMKTDSFSLWRNVPIRAITRKWVLQKANMNTACAAMWNISPQRKEISDESTDLQIQDYIR